VFVPGKPFQASKLFAIKAGAYLTEAHFRQAPDLTLKYTRLERLVKNKNSSLLRVFYKHGAHENREQKKFYNICTRSRDFLDCPRSWICASIPTRSSSTLWLMPGDVSMYLQPYLMAIDFPAGRNKNKMIFFLFRQISIT
jgi:hypothetical protein